MIGVSNPIRVQEGFTQAGGWQERLYDATERCAGITGAQKELVSILGRFRVVLNDNWRNHAVPNSPIQETAKAFKPKTRMAICRSLSRKLPDLSGR